MLQDREQGGFFVSSFLDPLVEIIVVGVRGKQRIELCFQVKMFFCIRSLAIVQKLVVILPILFAEVCQLLSMERNPWFQLLPKGIGTML